MKKRNSIFGLVLSLGLLFSMSTVQEQTTANAGYCVAKYALGNGGGAQAFCQATGAGLGVGSAAWAGAKAGGRIGAMCGGVWGLAIGAGIGAL